MTETKRYIVSLEIKRDLYVIAKNKREARKKIAKRLQNRKANSVVKIDYLEEHWNY